MDLVGAIGESQGAVPTIPPPTVDDFRGRVRMSLIRSSSVGMGFHIHRRGGLLSWPAALGTRGQSQLTATRVAAQKTIAMAPRAANGRRAPEGPARIAVGQATRSCTTLDSHNDSAGKVQFCA